MKYRTQSANVLNEADRFQAILDWQLFTHEQDARLFDYNNDIPWTPGEPLYQHPAVRESQRYMRLDDGTATEIDTWDGPTGNCARPMFQTMEYYQDDLGSWSGNRYERVLRYFAVVCEPCEVSWKRNEFPSNCWVCGTEFPGLKRLNLDYDKRMVYQRNPVSMDSIFEPFARASQDAAQLMRGYIAYELHREMGDMWRDIMQEILDARALYRAAGRERMRGISTHYVVYDEMSAYAAEDVSWSRRLWLNANPPQQVFWTQGVEEFHPPAQPANPFVSPEGGIRIELVPDVASYDPSWGESVSYRATEGIRRILQNAGPAIFEKPAPPKPTFPQYTHHGNYDDPSNWAPTPITRQRRRRNL